MLDQKEREQLTKQANATRNEIAKLRNSLNELSNQKEQLFSKKSDIDKKISNSITKVNKLREDRDSLVKQIQGDKAIRDKLNKETREKIDKVKEARDKKNRVMAKHKIKGNPMALKGEIERLEQTMEIEVISFKKEKEIMKQLKDLKKKFSDFKSISDVFDNMDSLSKEIDDLKKRSEDAHKRVQDAAKLSQEKHIQLMPMSNDLDKLKEQKLHAMAKISEIKDKIKKVDEGLRENLGASTDVSGKLEVYKKEAKKKKQEKEEAEMKKKEDFIREKMKKGGKLTTEDIIALQGIL